MEFLGVFLGGFCNHHLLHHTHHHQPLQSDDKEDGEQEPVPRGHVCRHLLARVHSHRVSDE